MPEGVTSSSDSVQEQKNEVTKHQIDTFIINLFDQVQNLDATKTKKDLEEDEMNEIIDKDGLLNGYLRFKALETALEIIQEKDTNKQSSLLTARINQIIPVVHQAIYKQRFTDSVTSLQKSLTDPNMVWPDVMKLPKEEGSNSARSLVEGSNVQAVKAYTEDMNRRIKQLALGENSTQETPEFATEGFMHNLEYIEKMKAEYVNYLRSDRSKPVDIRISNFPTYYSCYLIQTGDDGEQKIDNRSNSAVTQVSQKTERIEM